MKLCRIEWCERKSKTKNLCGTHYERLRRNGSPYALRIESHGMDGTKIYKCWASMKDRCCNKNSVNYKNYGARGISVCVKWRKSFTAFYKDMGDPPSTSHTIERLDVNGDYEPANCYWADFSTQAANKRPKSNSTGFIGVRAHYDKWRASVTFKGSRTHLGVFDTPEEAATWRDAYVIANGWPHTLNCSVGA